MERVNVLAEQQRSTMHMSWSGFRQAGNNPDDHANLGSVRKEEWRKSCELMLKQADVLKSFAEAVAKERDRA